MLGSVWLIVLFVKKTGTPEIYTLSLHDALPIFREALEAGRRVERLCTPLAAWMHFVRRKASEGDRLVDPRSEEHTSELQSRLHLVCRLLLEKKNLNPLGASSNTAREPLIATAIP